MSKQFIQNNLKMMKNEKNLIAKILYKRIIILENKQLLKKKKFSK